MKSMPSERVWDKHEIKAEIGRRGWRIRDVAMRYGVDPAVINRSVARRSPTTVGDQIVAHALGVSLHILFPERYDDRGHRLVKIKPLILPSSFERLSVSVQISDEARAA